MKVDLSIAILTCNEEKNIEECLKSVCGLADEIFIVDSFSTDRTLDIAKKYTDKIYQNKFESYPIQRNWALSNLPFRNKWVMFLDADELVSENLQKEIGAKLKDVSDEVSGIEVKRRFIWMGKWIRYGGLYPIWLLRIMRRENAWCDDSLVDENFEVNGKIIRFENDLIHDNKKGVNDWIEKHNRYASLKVKELFKSRERVKTGEKNNMAGFWGSQVKKKRWVREKIWNRFIPPLVRPFFYFFYRYFLRLGFLDGKAGFIYHFLHGFWYRLLIDVKYLELKGERSER